MTWCEHNGFLNLIVSRFFTISLFPERKWVTLMGKKIHSLIWFLHEAGYFHFLISFTSVFTHLLKSSRKIKRQINLDMLTSLLILHGLYSNCHFINSNSSYRIIPAQVDYIFSESCFLASQAFGAFNPIPFVSIEFQIPV